MRLYMLIMMQAPKGWRRTRFVEEMPPHDSRDEARRIAEGWARATIPATMAHEPYVAVVVRATGPYAHPHYITHQQINTDTVRSSDIMRAVKCKFDENYPEQFRRYDSAGASLQIGRWDMQVSECLSTSGVVKMATKNQVDSVVLPFLDRMIRCAK